GAGGVGLVGGGRAARLRGARVTGVDGAESGRRRGRALGGGFARPDEAPADADVVFHASATPAGLATAINCAGFEGVIVEMSGYGQGAVEVVLGGAFHDRGLNVVSSQVGAVHPVRPPPCTHVRRSEAAVRLRGSMPALDCLVAQEIAFDDAPRELPRVLGPGRHGLAPVIRYPQA